MNFAKYDINFNKVPFICRMTQKKLDELKTTLEEFINDTDYLDRKKSIMEMEMEYDDEKDRIDYQSISRISKLVMNHYKRILSDNFISVFAPWGRRPWSLAENYTALDKKFFVRTMNGFWYCLPIVKYSPNFMVVKTPDEIVREGDNVKAYNNRYTCMLGFIIDLAEYFLKEVKEGDTN